MNSTASARPRLVFIANTMYSSTLSGGDIHTLHMAEGAIWAGYRVHFLTCHALKAQLEARALPVTLTLTDDELKPPCKWDSLGGQLRLLREYVSKTRRTLAFLDEIHAEDVVYINTDFWWDSRPGLRSRARRKLMILGMDCPTLREIAFCSRPDVTKLRLPSLHYWLAQNYSLRGFRHASNKTLFYVHPNQFQRLRQQGYAERELVYISNGIDMARADAVPTQEKIYDVAWTGRVHPQKGIDDLLATFAFLNRQLPDFRAILIGNVHAALEPRITALGLKAQVHFSGYVSEAEKFRLLKSSRLFLMPSRYESWGIVIGEALACSVPVVAYELAAYRPIFGSLLQYVTPFELGAFQTAALAAVRQQRSGDGALPPQQLTKFKNANSWERAQELFCSQLEVF
jgi:glycosyltransferase involved in cell wall biosynthesis